MKALLTGIAGRLFVWLGTRMFPAIAWMTDVNGERVRVIIFSLTERDRNVYVRSMVEVLDDPVKCAELHGREEWK